MPANESDHSRCPLIKAVRNLLDNCTEAFSFVYWLMVGNDFITELTEDSNIFVTLAPLIGGEDRSQVVKKPLPSLS